MTILEQNQNNMLLKFIVSYAVMTTIICLCLISAINNSTKADMVISSATQEMRLEQVRVEQILKEVE